MTSVTKNEHFIMWVFLGVGILVFAGVLGYDYYGDYGRGDLGMVNIGACNTTCEDHSGVRELNAYNSFYHCECQDGFKKWLERKDNQ